MEDNAMAAVTIRNLPDKTREAIRVKAVLTWQP
ncbi:FitA-like ribbon-helix-helix domain-containing protein [Caenispirillum salinarum]